MCFKHFMQLLVVKSKTLYTSFTFAVFSLTFFLFQLTSITSLFWGWLYIVNHNHRVCQSVSVCHIAVHTVAVDVFSLCPVNVSSSSSSSSSSFHPGDCWRGSGRIAHHDTAAKDSSTSLSLALTLSLCLIFLGWVMWVILIAQCTLYSVLATVNVSCTD